MTESTVQKKYFIYDYELERQKKVWAFIILFSSLFIFFLTIIGFTNGISEMVTVFLENNLGFTNKWS
ncbi:MAG: hypothetical protein KJO59_15025, partial [Ignavibacteria bacterium]|nr:hypothetical protein [Ignavibacteria bacterium]